MSLEDSLHSAMDYHFAKCYEMYGENDRLFSDVNSSLINKGINEASAFYHSVMGSVAFTAYNLISSLRKN